MDRLSSITSLSFDQYIELCVDTSFIETLSSALDITKSKTRSFMTSYVFKHFISEIMNPSVRSPEDLEMIRKAETLIDAINTDRFSNLLSQYTTSFTIWKEFDRPRTATPFINKYKNLRTIRDINESHYYKRELKLLIDMTFLQLITMINSIDGENALSRIDSDPEPSPDNSLNDEFISSAKATFWSTFREELPSYDRVVVLLRDFAQRYSILVPNRVDLLQQLSEILDIEFIQQQLDTQAVTIGSLVQYMDYIVVKIKEIDIPAQDEIIDRWFHDLKISPISVSDPIYFLQTFFEYILNRLDKIHNLSIELTPTIRSMYEARHDTSMIE
ncbi:MAG: hypothetical protein PHG66_06505 [Candidatus Colwellbacteria bacterium]|nr:hypothetical protein [Candidatus Colwellbacteria bacterium]